MPLVSLRPRYNHSEHHIYLDYLAASLKGRHDQNIALTGNYGTGKSSVLDGLSRRSDFRSLARHPVTISLATLSSDQDHVSGADTTNIIQKEIVKQLLYSESPRKMAASRYHRIKPFSWRSSVGLAFGTAAALLSFAYLLGFRPPSAITWAEGFLGQFLWYSALLLLSSAVVVSIARLLYGRMRIGQVAAVGVSVSLEERSDSYFDQFLDEIVYFFAKTKCDLLIIEDIDRFDDTQIFEALRALNTILNRSGQIRRKPVRFVYAIKDGIFDKIGKVGASQDDLKSFRPDEAARTSRTKFFDLVIPIVPFITHENSRDLLKDELAGRVQIATQQVEINPKLIELVARHIPDMRLVRNIVNEFEVFLPIIICKEGISELSPDRLFAMIVYKNFHLADYERIVVGRSVLDDVYEVSRNIANTNLARINDEIRLKSPASRTADAKKEKARELGERLDPLGFIGLSTNHELNRSSISESCIYEQSFWQKVSLGEVSSFRFHTGRTWKNLRQADIEKAVGAIPGADYWDSKVVADVREEWKHLRDDRELLRHPAMRQLLRRKDLVSDKGESLTAAMARLKVSDLVRELILGGWIDEYFALYVSRFHDTYMGAPARNYLVQVVRDSHVDFNFSFGNLSERERNIEALLGETENYIFETRSIFNVEIFDYLLAMHDRRIIPTLKMMVAQGIDIPTIPDTEASRFLKSYLDSGHEQVALFSMLAPLWPGVFAFIANSNLRPEVLNYALLEADRTLEYKTAPFIQDYFDRCHRELLVLASSPQGFNAAHVITRLGLSIPSLDLLDPAARKVFVNAKAYKLDEANLACAIGDEQNLAYAIDEKPDLALDIIKSKDAEVYAYVTSNLKRYLEIVEESTATPAPISDSSQFCSVLSDLAETDDAELGAFLAALPEEVVCEDIDDVPESLWGLLAVKRRLKMSAHNIERYIEERGELDEDILASLEACVALDVPDEDTWSEERAQSLAIQLINYGDLTVEARVRLVQTLDLDDYVPLESISDRSHHMLTAKLREADLVEDCPSAYRRVGNDWVSQEYYLRSAPDFVTYIDEVTVAAQAVNNIFRSQSVADEIKNAMLDRVERYREVLSPPGALAIVDYARKRHCPISAVQLVMLARKLEEPEPLVGLIAQVAGSLDASELRDILSAMPKPYCELPMPNKRPSLPNTAEDLAILERLQELGIVLKILSPEKKSGRKDALYHSKPRG